MCRKGLLEQPRIDIIQSSGTASLDEVARLTIQNGWRMEPLLEDYILSITVSFSGPPDFRVSIVYDGVRYVRNEGEFSDEPPKSSTVQLGGW